ncbi:MAG: hypothetical protein IPJ65_29645 [Archangiaceae bacterium]|nr:hypothetical protein [Archangiaceae bacterium]
MTNVNAAGRPLWTPRRYDTVEEVAANMKRADKIGTRVEKDLFEAFGLEVHTHRTFLDQPTAKTRGDGEILFEASVPPRALVGLLYHEAGHTMFNERLDPRTPRAVEFEADVFAGIAAERTQRSAEPFLNWMKKVSDPTNPYYPTPETRVWAVHQGQELEKAMRSVAATEASVKEVKSALRTTRDETKRADLEARLKTLLTSLGQDVGAMKEAAKAIEDTDRKLGGQPGFGGYLTEARSAEQRYHRLEAYVASLGR